MTPQAWREMVDRTRELEYAMGSPLKSVAENEQETVKIQRRCLRATGDLSAGTLLESGMLEALRPAPPDAIMPFELSKVIGKRLTRELVAGEYLKWTFLAEPGVR